MMTYATFVDLFPLFVTLFCVVAFFAFLLIKTPFRYGIKLIGIPAILIWGVLSFTTVTSMLGKPLKDLPPDGFVPIAFIVYNITTEEIVLQAWVYEPPDGKTRVYQFPYTPQRKKELEAAMKEQAESGIMYQGRWIEKEGPAQGSDRLVRGELKMTPVPPKVLRPKK